MNFSDADDLNGAIRTICIRHRAAAAAKLIPLGLHPGHETVLFELDANGPQSQSELAHAAGCEPPTITSMVRKLEARGLIERSRSEADARANVVTLTEKGHAALPALRRAWQELADETISTLTHSVPETVAALQDLARCLENQPEPTP